MFMSHLPYNIIKGCDTKNIPFVRYPAPRGRRPINSNPVSIFDEEEDECWYERDAVAAQQIDGLNLSQRSGVVFVVKGKIDVDGHGQRPIYIGWHGAMRHHCMLVLAVLESHDMDRKTFGKDIRLD